MSFMCEWNQELYSSVEVKYIVLHRLKFIFKKKLYNLFGIVFIKIICTLSFYMNYDLLIRGMI